MSSCRSEVFVLYRIDRSGRRDPLGWYYTVGEAACAMEEERQKEDGVQLEINLEEEQK